MRTVQHFINKVRLRFQRRQVKMARELILSPGRILMQGKRCLRLTRTNWQKHVFIAGGSGQGKSKMIEGVIRHLIKSGEGVTIIDPHGDSARAVLAFCAANNIDPSRVVHLKPDTRITFAIDPLAEIPLDCGEIEMQAHVQRVAGELIDAFLRENAAADRDMMKRLQHQLTDLVWLAAIPVNGKRLGLADLQSLVNPSVLKSVLDHAGATLKKYAPVVYGELVRMQDTKSESLRDKWLESTTNLLSGIMGVHLQLILGQHATPLRPRDLIQQRKIVLVDVSREEDGSNPGLSRATANVIAGILLNMLISAARRTKEEDRVDHYLFIDEAENFLGEDLRMGFSEMRKFRLYFCIAFQDLSCLKKGELDLVERVISICCTWFIFCQQDFNNAEYLGQCIKLADLDLTPLMVDTTYPDGYEWHDTESLSMQINASVSESTSHSSQVSITESRQRSTSESIQHAVALALSANESEGQSDTRSSGGAHAEGKNWQQSDGTSKTESNGWNQGTMQSQSEGSSEGKTWNNAVGYAHGSNGATFSSNDGRSSSEAQTHAINNGQSSGRSASESTAQSSTDSRGGSVTDTSSWGDAHAKSRQQGRGLSLTLNLGRGATNGESRGVARSLARGLSKTLGATRGFSLGITRQKVPLAKHRFAKVPNGKTIVAVADQFYAMMRDIARLPERTVMVKVKGMNAPFLMEVHEVKDVPRDGVEDYLKKVHRAPFYFVPNDAAHMGRIQRFLEKPPMSEKKSPIA